MSHDERAFLAAIAAHPDADLPRLVFADWLDENGQPERAEFIRLEIELAPGIVDTFLRGRLIRRRNELLAANEQVWRSAFPFDATVHFRRGFIEVCEADAATVSRCAENWFASTPLRQLTISHVGTELAKVSRLPELSRLNSLKVIGLGTSLPDLFSIFDRTDMAHLTELGLSGNVLGDAGTSRLVNCPAARSLHTLQLDRCVIGDEGLAVIANSEHLTCLQSLTILGNPFTPAVLGTLEGSGFLAGLRRFEMDCPGPWASTWSYQEYVRLREWFANRRVTIHATSRSDSASSPEGPPHAPHSDLAGGCVRGSAVRREPGGGGVAGRRGRSGMDAASRE